MPKKKKAKNAVGRSRKKGPISTPDDSPHETPLLLKVLAVIMFALMSGSLGGFLQQHYGIPDPPKLSFLDHAYLLCRADEAFSHWTPCIDKHGMFYDAQDRAGMELRIFYEQPMRIQVQ